MPAIAELQIHGTSASSQIYMAIPCKNIQNAQAHETQHLDLLPQGYSQVLDDQDRKQGIEQINGCTESFVQDLSESPRGFRRITHSRGKVKNLAALLDPCMFPGSLDPITSPRVCTAHTSKQSEENE